MSIRDALLRNLIVFADDSGRRCALHEVMGAEAASGGAGEKLAALFHDVSRQLSVEEAAAWLERIWPRAGGMFKARRCCALLLTGAFELDVTEASVEDLRHTLAVFAPPADGKNG